MNMGEKIRELRIQQGMTLEELGDKVGVGKSTVRKWENGMIANMKRDKILNVANALGTTPSYLMGWKEEKETTVKHRTGIRIPVYGRVAAGIPIEMITDIVDEEEITEELARRGEYFGLTIHGDSMEPRIWDGDIVIVRSQDDAESGELVIATVNGSDATCKRLKKYDGGIWLMSTNTKYEPMNYTDEEIRNKPVKILGKVVEVRGKLE